MKINFSAFFLLSLTLTLVACKDGVKVSTPLGAVGSGTTNQITESSKYSYEFSINGCSDKHEFDSLEKLCRGLQNNTLNKVCTEDEREDFFKIKCSGQTFKPFTEDQQKVSSSSSSSSLSSNVPENYDVKNMVVGTNSLDVLKHSPEGASSLKSALAIFSCAESVSENDSDVLSGFIFLNKSKAVINRDLNYRFGDGTSSSHAKAHVYFTCDSKDNNNQKSELSGSEESLKDLSPGHAVMVPVIVSPPNHYPVQSALTFVSCSETLEDAQSTGVNGVGLIVGSRLAVHRDLNYQYGNGSSVKGNYLMQIISCNK